MGLVMVAGITAKNGILLLDQAERGHASRVASERGVDRSRAISFPSDPDDDAGDGRGASPARDGSGSGRPCPADRSRSRLSAGSPSR